MPPALSPAAAAAPPSPHVPLRLGAVAMVAIVPAAGAAYAAFEALRSFDAMTRYEGPYGNGHGGLATVAAVFSHVNASLLAALILGLALTVFLRFVRQRDPALAEAIPATRLSLVAAFLAGVPAWIVYYAESGALASLANPGLGSVAAASERLLQLLRIATVAGLAVALLGVVAAAIGWRSRRWVGASAMPWMASGAVLLALAIAFAMRSFALHELAAAAERAPAA